MAGQASIEGGEGRKGPLQKAALARPHSSRPALPRPTCAKEARKMLSWTTSASRHDAGLAEVRHTQSPSVQPAAAVPARPGRGWMW
jgi:hypothetical protein